jgi:hypothetical protein
MELMHSPHFLRYLLLKPATSIIFAGDSGLHVLASSKYVIVDGTFDLVEEKLVLMTLMGYHDGIAVPCAYYLSEFKTHDSYLCFFQVLFICSPYYMCVVLKLIYNTKSYQASHQGSVGPHR